jgi:hypothetical protein
MTKPLLIHWGSISDLWAHVPAYQKPCVRLSSSSKGYCYIYPDGTLDLRTAEGTYDDPLGAFGPQSYQFWIALIEEARSVAKHYYGEAWGESTTG